MLEWSAICAIGTVNLPPAFNYIFVDGKKNMPGVQVKSIVMFCLIVFILIITFPKMRYYSTAIEMA